MRLVTAGTGQSRDVVVEVDDADATIADLADAVGLGHGLEVDGRYVSPDTPLREAGLHDGAVLRSARAAPPAQVDVATRAWIAVVAGDGTGERIGLAPHRTIVVGRQADCDLGLASPTISNRHALVTMTDDGDVIVEDADSRNGTWVDGVAIHGPTRVEVGTTIRMGAVVVLVQGPDEDDTPSGRLVPDGLTSTLAFNRPPRPAPAVPPAPPTPPQRPEPTMTARGFRLAALVSPVLMGAFMVMRTGNILYAGFAIISPIALVATWLADRRRTGRQARHLDSAYARALQRHADDLREAWTAHRQVVERAAPSMAEVVRRARAPSTRLWERRLDQPDALCLRVGSADQPWHAVLQAPDSDRTAGADTPPADTPRADTPRSDTPGADTTRTGETDRRDAASAGDDLGAGEVTAALRAVVDAHACLPSAPVTIDLRTATTTTVLAGSDDVAGAGSSSGVVGIVGDGVRARALARALLVQATTLHGPADLQVGVFATPGCVGAWDWAKWLPHTCLPDGRTRMVSDDSEVSRRLVDDLFADRAAPVHPQPAGRAHGRSAVPFLVIDDLGLLAGRAASARLLLAGGAGPVAGIVIAATADQLPASCGVVVDCGADGVASVRWPALGHHLGGVITAGTTTAMALTAARAMARWDDPELPDAGGRLPDLVRLPPLLGMDRVDAEAVARRWAQAPPDPGAPATFGATAAGPFTLDLRRDGPHALIGGTTGSGKSELLRSVIAGMALTVDPDHLVFVLVDYKGGSAFDACADLPHVVGLVTDLDDHLGRRTLVSLEAELHLREVVLRDAGADDLPAYLQAGAPGGPLPRLVVVIDEFATLAAELPDFLGALVDIAQRGRSLGIHLVLATQRPRGVVDAKVRDNVDLRIALRVQDPAGSSDIVDSPAAADLPRDRPGRAWVRRGHGDLVLVQSALATAGAPAGTAPVRVGPFPFAPHAHLPGPALSGRTDLDRLVTACRAAFEASGRPAPRRPWLSMPPARIDLTDLLADPRSADIPVVVALEDVPEAQDQRPAGWDPAEGHLALLGQVGQGTTTALLAVAAAVAATSSPERVHLHGIDFGGGALAPLTALPHTGAIVDTSDTERQARLVAMLLDQLRARRAMTAAERRDRPQIVVLVDKFAAFLAEHDTIESRAIGEGFQRVCREGPAVGIAMAITGEHARDIPSRLASAVATTWRFRQAEGTSSTSLRPRDMPDLSPGRAWDQASGHVVQVGLPPDPATLATAWPPAVTHVPDPVATLPERVSMGRITAAPAPVRGASLRIPVGLAHDLGTATLEVHPGDHVLIAGPPRSGRSNALQVLSAQVRSMLPHAHQLAVCDPLRSPLADYGSLDGAGTLDQLAPYLQLAIEDDGPWFVLVDDAGQYAGSELFADLVAARPRLHVVAAGRPSSMRGSFGSWLRTLAASRTGILLRPDLPGDGDLLSATLPRRTTTPLVTGRGWVVSAGQATLAQTARRCAVPPPGGLGALRAS